MSQLNQAASDEQPRGRKRGTAEGLQLQPAEKQTMVNEGAMAAAASESDASTPRPFPPPSASSAATAVPTLPPPSHDSGSGFTRPGQTRQLEQGREGEEQPRKKKQKAEQPQPAAAATASTAAPAATPSRAPLNVLDLDSLSVCLSFLNTRDFLSAIRVSRQFRAARTRRSAWPQLHVASFIRALQDDDYDKPTRRRLVCTSARLAKLLAHPQSMQMWRHVTDIKLGNAEEKDEAALLQLLNFPCLSALTLTDCKLSALTVHQLYSGLADRLQALLLFRCSGSAYRQLNCFTSLRILVLNRPPKAHCLMQLHQLEYLHVDVSEWEIRDPIALVRVIRWMSVTHHLRSLSLEIPAYLYEDSSERLFCSVLLNEEDPSVGAVGAVAAVQSQVLPLEPPLDWSLPCPLTDLSISNASIAWFPSDPHLLFSRLDRLPHLTRLQWTGTRLHSEHSSRCLNLLPVSGPLLPSTRACLSQLQQLRVTIKVPWFGDTKPQSHTWRHLAVCTQLRTLRVGLQGYTQSEYPALNPAPAATLQQLLAVWAPRIEEIRLEPNVWLEYSDKGSSAELEPATAAATQPVATGALAYDSAWTSLAACHQLRMLELPLQAKIPVALMRALGSLPHFRTLELSWHGAQPAAPADVLSCMLASCSWSTLHLRALSSAHAPSQSQINPRGGLSKQLAALQLPLSEERARQRIRVIALGASRVVSFQIGERNGKIEWQRQ